MDSKHSSPLRNVNLQLNHKLGLTKLSRITKVADERQPPQTRLPTNGWNQRGPVSEQSRWCLLADVLQCPCSPMSAAPHP